MEPVRDGVRLGVTDGARRRALGALRGLAIGDAIGAATEGYRPEEIEDVYDAPIFEFVEPINLYPESAADRGFAQIGPVTHSALGALTMLAEERGTATVTTLGWAVMLGIGTRTRALGTMMVDAGRFPGDVAAGVAVAAAVSAGVEGFLPRDAVGHAARAARAAGAPDLARRLLAAAGAGQESGGAAVGAAVAASFPPGPSESEAVSFAFGVAFGTQSARRAMLQAANQGGAASLSCGIAGAICGALLPGTLVEAWARTVEAANAIDLSAVAGAALALRAARDRGV